MRLRHALLAFALIGCHREPAIVDAWGVAGVGIHPIELETALAVRCDHPTIVVGPSSVYLMDDGPPVAFTGPADDASLLETIRHGLPMTWRYGLMSGAYNGPGGEPLFRWYVDQPERPTVLLDRSLSTVRLDAVLAALDELSAPTLLVAGIDATGARTCFATLRPAVLHGTEMMRPYEAVADPNGHLSSERDGVAFEPEASLDPWWHQERDVRIPVHVRRDAQAGVYGLIRGAARVPSLARWPVLAEPGTDLGNE